MGTQCAMLSAAADPGLLVISAVLQLLVASRASASVNIFTLSTANEKGAATDAGSAELPGWNMSHCILSALVGSNLGIWATVPLLAQLGIANCENNTQ